MIIKILQLLDGHLKDKHKNNLLPGLRKVYAIAITDKGFHIAYNCNVNHSEINLIKKIPDNEKIFVIYTSKFPCEHCAKELIKAKIQLLISEKTYSNSKWLTTQNNGKKLFENNDIPFLEVDRIDE